MFVPHKNAAGNVIPWETLPCSAITPKIGMALTQSSGKLAIATGTTAPTYISMVEKDSAQNGFSWKVVACSNNFRQMTRKMLLARNICICSTRMFLPRNKKEKMAGRRCNLKHSVVMNPSIKAISREVTI